MAYSKTPEEQKMITRQSQIKTAQTYFQQCGICPSLSDLIRTTEYLSIYIEKGMDIDYTTGVSRMTKMMDKLDEELQKNYKG